MSHPNLLADPPARLRPQPAPAATAPAGETRPAPGRRRRSAGERVQLGITLLITILPLAGVVLAAGAFLSPGPGAVSLTLLVVGYVATGLGITVGFHRLFTHRSFRAVPALRYTLAVAGSLAFEGGVIGWVATHRRHHAFADRDGDPHSPRSYASGRLRLLRGLFHGHMGWLFTDRGTDLCRYAPDLLADPVMRRIDRAFPAFCVLSLGLPTAIGWGASGTASGAVDGLLWGGLVRVFVLHHVTWSVNSLCHLLGPRPFATRRGDRASNLWPLALISFGDSWHNYHHADPSSARHGVDRRQVDMAAGLIRGFERLGWASRAQWPTPERCDDRRRATDS